MARLFDLSAVKPSDLTRFPGTPPEAFLDPPDYNEKIDVFSVGVLIIEMPKPSDQFDVVNPSTSILRKESERRADHIALCDNNPLMHVALCCLQDNKDRRPSARECCVEVVCIQLSQKYKEEQNLAELVACNDVQKIVKEITKNFGMIQIQALQVQVTSLQQEESSRKAIQDLQVRVSDLTNNMQEMQQEMRSQWRKTANWYSSKLKSTSKSAKMKMNRDCMKSVRRHKDGMMRLKMA